MQCSDMLYNNVACELSAGEALSVFQVRHFVCFCQPTLSLRQIWPLLRDAAADAEHRDDRHHAHHAEPVHQRPHGQRTQHQEARLHRSANRAGVAVSEGGTGGGAFGKLDVNICEGYFSIAERGQEWRKEG